MIRHHAPRFRLCTCMHVGTHYHCVPCNIDKGLACKSAVHAPMVVARRRRGCQHAERCSTLPPQERRFPEAFSALSEAVKHKRESWQTWANYAHAALQTGRPLQAARSVAQVGLLLPLLAHVAQPL